MVTSPLSKVFFMRCKIRRLESRRNIAIRRPDEPV